MVDGSMRDEWAFRDVSQIVERTITIDTSVNRTVWAVSLQQAIGSLAACLRQVEAAAEAGTTAEVTAGTTCTLRSSAADDTSFDARTAAAEKTSKVCETVHADDETVRSVEPVFDEYMPLKSLHDVHAPAAPMANFGIRNQLQPADPLTTSFQILVRSRTHI
ncbi:MAG: hypothetical protein ABGZ53_06325 [Fuerstiella sp.]